MECDPGTEEDQAEDGRPPEPAVEEPAFPRWKRVAVRAGAVAVACCVMAAFVFFALKLGRGTPEKTVDGFFRAIEADDAGLLLETLSGDDRYAGQIAESLDPSGDTRVEITLVDDISPEQVEELESFLEGQAYTDGVTYVPAREDVRGDLVVETSPPVMMVGLGEPAGYTRLEADLKKSPFVAENPGTGEKLMDFPMEEIARAFLARVMEGVTFRDMEYASASSGDSALVRVADGTVAKVDEGGEVVPLSSEEFGRLSMFPTGFLLEKQDGRWRIVGFPPE